MAILDYNHAVGELQKPTLIRRVPGGFESFISRLLLTRTMPGYQVLEQVGGFKSRRSFHNLGSGARNFNRFLWAFLFLLGSAVFLGFYGVPLISRRFRQGPVFQTDWAGDKLEQCASGLPPLASPPAGVNIWAPLTTKEIVEVTQWLEAPEQGYNLTSGDVARLGDNSIFLVETYQPTKASALAYLSSPSTNNPPARYARVTIHHGAEQDPFILDHLVGPLPVSYKTTARPLTEIYHRDKIPFNARGYTAQVGIELVPLLSRIMEPLSNVTKVCDVSQIL